MSQKRASKLAKRQRKRRKKQAAQRRKRSLLFPPKPVNSPLSVVNPYASVEVRDDDLMSEEFEIHELSEAEYQIRFEHYKQMPSYESRVALLSTYEQETQYAFDPEEILELFVDEILAQEPADTLMTATLRSTTLRWIDIVNYIKTTDYHTYAEWMLPAIAVCGYALE